LIGECFARDDIPADFEVRIDALLKVLLPDGIDQHLSLGVQLAFYMPQAHPFTSI